MDFFAGSGTTGDAVYRMNMEKESKGGVRFILVQLPEPIENDKFKTIADIAKSRLSGVSNLLAKGGSETNTLDRYLGFRVFKLSDSSVKQWDTHCNDLEPALLNAIENIKRDRTERDVLFEILLKYGLDLAVSVEERQIEGKVVYIVGAGALIVCLADGITLGVVEGIAALKAELQPEIMRVVFKDAGFPNDVVKTNTVQILRHAGIDDVKSL
jgi:adenine-specific DNA-methyltransferase